MSWIFRKVFKSGPVRTTVSKKGIGVSWGIPCFRVGISSTGRKYFSIRIPGTSLYFIKYLSPIKIAKGTNASFEQSQSKEILKREEEPWWKQDNL